MVTPSISSPNTINSVLRLQVTVAEDTAFANKLFDKNFNLDQSSLNESVISKETFRGIQSDVAIDLSSIDNVTAVLIFASSVDKGADDAPLPITFKIGAGTAFQAQTVFLAVDQPSADGMAAAITFSAPAGTGSPPTQGSLTSITVVAIGRDD